MRLTTFECIDRRREIRNSSERSLRIHSGRGAVMESPAALPSCVGRAVLKSSILFASIIPFPANSMTRPRRPIPIPILSPPLRFGLFSLLSVASVHPSAVSASASLPCNLGFDSTIIYVSIFLPSGMTKRLPAPALSVWALRSVDWAILPPISKIPVVSGSAEHVLESFRISNSHRAVC